ncbi:MAG: sulfatase-like hydrolase/transferase [Opitutaceae bacterium]|nr:sulfatase-like hydrolase/transferase [Opitutaceae bacterium]
MSIPNLRFVSLLLAAVIAATIARSAQKEGRPNIVFFLTDDQPYSGLSATGGLGTQTPAIDRLAAEGVLFENAFATTAICCCSRASILTGQYMRRHGIEDFQKPLSDAQLALTFPVLLREHGYRTAFLGKFAVGSPEIDERRALPAHLFDLWYGFPQSVSFRQTEGGRTRYLTTLMTEKAVEFMDATPRDQPFCLIMALKEPHGPLDYQDPEFTPPAEAGPITRPSTLTHAAFDHLPAVVRESLAASPRLIDSSTAFESYVRLRNAYIARADLAVAQVRAALAARGLDRNTVVIFASDHGVFMGAHGLNGKWLMYEESIRLPLIISDPRLPVSTRGRRTAMALNIDLAPTFLAIAGVPIPTSMQGGDLQPLLRDPAARIHTDWFYEHVFTDSGRRPIPKVEGVRTERWKYIRYPGTHPLVEELFDLAVDPHEESNLAGLPDQRAMLGDLRTRCDTYEVSLK